MKLSMCRSISFKSLFVKDGTTNGWVFAENCLYPTRVRTEKLWQVFKHSFVAPAVNNGKLPRVVENLKMGTKCDFRQNPIPHHDGCQQSLDARHIFQVLTKHFWFWKRNKHFNQEWEDGKVSQNTCSKPLCPCFSERRRPLQVFSLYKWLFRSLKNSVAVFGSPWRWPNNKNDNNNENDKMKKIIIII